MESFEINKILGALLGTCLVLVAVHIASGAVFSPEKPAKPGYEIAVKEEEPAQGGTAAKPPAQPIENLLAAASIQQGTSVAKQCLACHNFGKGQGNKVGPDLYGIVGRQVAAEPGFNYSGPLKAKGGTWTFDALNTWLTDPRADVPGTLMTFAGISSEKQRADVIDYLNSNSDQPLPLPTAKNEAAAPSAPAGKEAAPANPAAPAANPQAAAPANPTAAPEKPPAAPAANPQAAAPANPPAPAPEKPPAAPAANPQAAAPANPPAPAPEKPPTAPAANPQAAAPANPPAPAPPSNDQGSAPKPQ